MKLYAITINGMQRVKRVEITKISVWINRTVNHSVSEVSLSALLNEAKESKQMQIYDGCPVEKYNGQIDAFSGTPLFTNGQESVYSIEDETGNILYNRLNQQ